VSCPLDIGFHQRGPRGIGDRSGMQITGYRQRLSRESPLIERGIQNF